MKKPIAIACVLLLLAVFIGVERFKATSRSKPSAVSHADPLDPKPQPPPKVRPQNYPDSAATIPSSANIVAIPAVEVDSEKADFTSAPAPSSAGNAVSEYKISAIHFIRGETILRAYKPDNESIPRLREAAKQVATKFENPVIIFDLDGLTTSQSPFVSYANPKFELTKEVEAVYLKLRAKDAAAGQGKITGHATASEGDQPPE